MTYNIGKDEIIWEQIYGTDERLHYLITSDKRRDVYFLYRVDKDNTVSKVGKAKTPPELWKKYLGGKAK